MLTHSFVLTTSANDPIGTFFDQLAGLINHSCSPNAFMVMDGPKLSVRSLRSIKKDEEILISYVDATEPYAFRQEALSTIYAFDYACSKCSFGATQREDQFLEPRAELKNKSLGLAKNIQKDQPGFRNRLNKLRGINGNDERLRYVLDIMGRHELEEIEDMDDPANGGSYTKLLNLVRHMDTVRAICCYSTTLSSNTSQTSLGRISQR
jgi:SET and MYND domain-containing protein